MHSNSSLPQNVYVVWVGEYSDRDVLAIFSSRESAQALVASRYNPNYPHYYGASIEEIPVDDPETMRAIRDIRPRWAYRTEGWHSDRTAREVIPTLAPESPPKRVQQHVAGFLRGRDASFWEGVISASSEEQALKIANDIYARLQAEAAGIT